MPFNIKDRLYLGFFFSPILPVYNYSSIDELPLLSPHLFFIHIIPTYSHLPTRPSTMHNPATPKTVLCTFPDCPCRFNTIGEMKKHKSCAPEHEYCARCDEDFENEERHLIHKIKSNKHIVCPICSVDFRSEGGRDGHIRQVICPRLPSRSSPRPCH